MADAQRDIHMLVRQIDLPVGQHEPQVNLRLFGEEIQSDRQQMAFTKEMGAVTCSQPRGALYSPAACRSAVSRSSRMRREAATKARPHR